MRWWVRWLLLFLAAVALPALLIGWKHWSFGRDFDAEVWQDQVAIHEAARQGMADRLIADGTLIGKTRTEVVEPAIVAGSLWLSRRHHYQNCAIRADIVDLVPVASIVSIFLPWPKRNGTPP